MKRLRAIRRHGSARARYALRAVSDSAYDRRYSYISVTRRRAEGLPAAVVVRAVQVDLDGGDAPLFRQYPGYGGEIIDVGRGWFIKLEG